MHTTKLIPADQLTIGTKFIPEGKKRPVEIFFIGDNAAGSLDLYCTSTSGNSAHIVSRYSQVLAVIPNRAA